MDPSQSTRMEKMWNSLQAVVGAARDQQLRKNLTTLVKKVSVVFTGAVKNRIELMEARGRGALQQGGMKGLNKTAWPSDGYLDRCSPGNLRKPPPISHSF